MAPLTGGWWVRWLVALGLPLVVPAVVVAALWAAPGAPVDLLGTPAGGVSTSAVAERWNLDQGPVAYYLSWLGGALRGELGRSWFLQQGAPIGEMVASSVGWTGLLVGSSGLGLVAGALVAGAGWVPRQVQAAVAGVGLVPAVVAALGAAAVVELSYGAVGGMGLRVGLGVGVLLFADAALGEAMHGADRLMTSERSRRYVGMARLRGESTLANMLPNVLPAWVAQLHGRILHLVSGAVVVEVLLGIPGLGELLFDGTLLQDFPVVLAASWAASVGSAGLLLAHAAVDALVARWVRMVPA